jgi:mono/diheme cytochrome c family protein
MRNFILGMLFVIAVLVIGAAGLALLGFIPTRANTPPPEMERHLAMSALDNAVERHAPRVNNPVPPSDENLISGMKLYSMQCAMCHGDLDRKPSTFETSFYPPAPNLVLHPPDDPEWHLYYVIHNGIRYTGMPAWDKTIAETDMWKITAFLSHMKKLPPTVQDAWKKATGAAPPATDGPGEHHDH